MQHNFNILKTNKNLFKKKKKNWKSFCLGSSVSSNLKLHGLYPPTNLRAFNTNRQISEHAQNSGIHFTHVYYRRHWNEQEKQIAHSLP